MRLTGITIGLGLTLLGTAIAFHTIRASAPPVPKVALLRTPNQGIQPQTVLDANDVLHMIYFKGDVSAGDIEYVRVDPSGHGFSEPIRVNSEPGSTVAIGTVRGPQLSVGRNGRAYVIWFGPQAKSGDPTATMPVFFARLNDSGTLPLDEGEGGNHLQPGRLAERVSDGFAQNPIRALRLLNAVEEQP